MRDNNISDKIAELSEQVTAVFVSVVGLAHDIEIIKSQNETILEIARRQEREVAEAQYSSLPHRELINPTPLRHRCANLVLSQTERTSYMGSALAAEASCKHNPYSKNGYVRLLCPHFEMRD